MVASEVLHEMRKVEGGSQLVQEATMVSRELMRVAITPHELWYDGLEQAAQLYMEAQGSQGIILMLSVLAELHDAMSEADARAHLLPEQLQVLVQLVLLLLVRHKRALRIELARLDVRHCVTYRSVNATASPSKRPRVG